MDIIPNILGETEFREFTKSDYVILCGILDDQLAKYIKTYTENPEADQELVQVIKENLSETLDSLTLHFVLKEKGIIDLVDKLSPEALLLPSTDLNEIKESLTFLKENENKLRYSITPRTKAQFEEFSDMIDTVLRRLQSKGITPSYPNIPKKIQSNKFLFYIPNDKGHTTSCNVISSKSKQWNQCLKGIQFIDYCNQNNISPVDRRAF